jgi:uncharacterized LabA/DUF88 family protein
MAIHKPRANFYVDGFNLYNGALRGSPYKWLDLAQLAAKLAPHCDVNQVRFFTAMVTGDQARRQDVYLRALRAQPATAVHTEGRFIDHTVTRPLAKKPSPEMAAVLEHCLQPGSPWTALPHPSPNHWVRVSVRDRKEKGTDVNLATMLLVEAFTQACDEAYVISGDSDLQMPVTIVAGMMKVTVVNPVMGRRSKELQAAGSAYTTLNPGILATSQLPPVVNLPGGKSVKKPQSW